MLFSYNQIYIFRFKYDYQAFLDVVGRCRDYERAILDVLEIIDTIRFELNDLQSSVHESPSSSPIANIGPSSPQPAATPSPPNPTTTRHPSHNDLEGLGSSPPTHPDTPAPPAAPSPLESNYRHWHDSRDNGNLVCSHAVLSFKVNVIIFLIQSNMSSIGLGGLYVCIIQCLTSDDHGDCIIKMYLNRWTNVQYRNFYGLVLYPDIVK